MKRLKLYYSKIFVLFSFLFTACIDPYTTHVSDDKINLLVVDGFLNSTNSSASVNLSRTIPLSESKIYPAEKNAIVTINDENGLVANLNETEAGHYSATGLILNTSSKYQLKIKTAAGKEYASDFIPVKVAPSIDSITWKPYADGISLYVNSHDLSGNTRYYQWSYKEVWEYKSDYPSSYYLIDGKIYPRPPSDDIYTCWNTELSSKILIQSTSKLKQDMIRDFPITSVPRGSKKLSRTYSLLVQQRALTVEAYNFYEQLRKINESLGGLFDPLPSEVTGNIHSTSESNESVLGYFGGSSVQEKRIFIDFYDLPSYLLYIPRSSCLQDSIPLAKLKEYPNSTLIISGYGFVLEGYLTSTVGCIDCRYAGGTTTKPDFWP